MKVRFLKIPNKNKKTDTNSKTDAETDAGAPSEESKLNPSHSVTTADNVYSAVCFGLAMLLSVIVFLTTLVKGNTCWVARTRGRRYSKNAKERRYKRLKN